MKLAFSVGFLMSLNIFASTTCPATADTVKKMNKSTCIQSLSNCRIENLNQLILAQDSISNMLATIGYNLAQNNLPASSGPAAFNEKSEIAQINKLMSNLSLLSTARRDLDIAYTEIVRSCLSKSE
jgi:hypothetical protein